MATLSNTDIARAIYQNSKDKTGSELTSSLQKTVKFLYRRNLLTKKDDILEKLENLINDSNGIVIAKVWSAKKLSGEIKNELTHFLKKNYSAKEVHIEEHIDEKLLGGVRIEINNEVIDLSIKNKISQLQKHLTREN